MQSRPRGVSAALRPPLSLLRTQRPGQWGAAPRTPARAGSQLRDLSPQQGWAPAAASSPGFLLLFVLETLPKQHETRWVADGSLSSRPPRVPSWASPAARPRGRSLPFLPCPVLCGRSHPRYDSSFSPPRTRRARVRTPPPGRPPGFLAAALALRGLAGFAVPVCSFW